MRIPVMCAPKRFVPVRVAAGLAIGVASAALGQSGGGFDLTWNTIDGGGATFSTGGGFELGGTIGQPDATVTVMTGGDFALAGGFWFSKISCNAPPQDTNADGDVDLNDFLKFQECFNGPNLPWQPTGDQLVCLCLDENEDGDVDFADFQFLQACFN